MTAINKYEKSKIYRIYTKCGAFYYGSTRSTLEKRFKQHQAYQYFPTKLSTYCSNIGWDNVQIELVQEICCSSSKELLRIEGEYIRKHFDEPGCLNMKRQ